MTREKSFGIIPIIKKDGKHLFLLVKHGKGHWAFPKGHSVGKESEIDTAKREFEEETGIKDYEIIENAYFDEDYFFRKEDQLISKTVRYFLAIVKNPSVTIQKEEISDYKWVDFDAAMDLITFKEAKRVLDEAEKYLETHRV